MKRFDNQKGMSAVLLLLIVVGVAGAGVLILTKSGSFLKKTQNDSTAVVYKEPVVKSQPSDEIAASTDGTDSFVPIKEDKSTPKEIDNSVVNELDSLIISVDNDTEDMSDL